MDPAADVDPLFTDFLDKPEIDRRNILVSRKSLDEYLKELRVSRLTFLVVRRDEQKSLGASRLVARKALDPEKMIYMSSLVHAQYIREGRDLDSHAILIFGVIPFRFSKYLFAGEPRYGVPLAPFAREALPFVVKPQLERHIGVHVRHGNSEYLSGRPEGGGERFENMVTTIVEKTKALRDNTGCDVLVFSDNCHVAASLASELNAEAPSVTSLSDKPFQQQLSKQSDEKRYSAIAPIISDFFHLSHCQYIVSGSSLFTSSSYLFSAHRRMLRINEKELVPPSETVTNFIQL